MVGFGTSYRFEYKRGKQEFSIEVPKYKYAQLDNYNDLAYRIYSQPNPNMYELEFQTLFLDELQNGVKEFLAKTEKEKTK